MPQPKLTKQMIKIIIQLRDDETENWTYPRIQEYLMEHFNLSISVQSLRKSYNKNKPLLNIGVPSNEQNLIHPNDSIQGFINGNVQKNKPIFKPKKRTATLSEPLFEKDEEVDLQNLFDKAE